MGQKSNKKRKREEKMRQIKKLASVLAAVLLASQVIAVMPVHAEEAKEKCFHEGCTNYSEGCGTVCSSCAGKETTVSCDQNDDGISHQWIFKCSGCEDPNKEQSIKQGCSYKNGVCVGCGRSQGEVTYTCAHPGCGNEVDNLGDICSKCTGVDPIQNFCMRMNESSHVEGLYYPCCATMVDGQVKPHEFNSDGSCKCGYKKQTNTEPSEDTNENTTTNQNESIGDTGSESNNQNETVVEEVKTVSVTSGGKVFTSAVSSIYATTEVNGAVVTTPKQSVNEAVGINEDNANVSFFVCNNKNAKKFEQMGEQAQKSGKTLYNIFNSDLYTITKKGGIEKVHSTEKPVTLMFGLPSTLQNKKVSIIAYNNKTGEYVEFEDIDNDPKTITIDATVFGVYALVVSE